VQAADLVHGEANYRLTVAVSYQAVTIVRHRRGELSTGCPIRAVMANNGAASSKSFKWLNNTNGDDNGVHRSP
jgi:hypothetical protein